jgi:hypothetical protein
MSHLAASGMVADVLGRGLELEALAEVGSLIDLVVCGACGIVTPRVNRKRRRCRDCLRKESCKTHRRLSDAKRILICTVCGELAEVVSHYRQCRKCRSMKQREYNARNKEQKRQRRLERYQNDPEYRDSVCEYSRRKKLRRAQERADEHRPNDQVYFVRDSGTGYTKIGFTSKPIEQRLRHLQTGNPRELVLLACVPGAPLDERRLHGRFAADRVRSEWFRSSPELLAYIDSVARPQAAAA